MTSCRKTSPKDETAILIKNRRRCCLCFGLNADGREKPSQIARLNRDPSNASEGNLVYLCLEHHDSYDSTTRQSKGLTIWEMRHYRDSLYRALGSMSDQALQVLTGTDRELLNTMLGRAKGWYDEVVHVIADAKQLGDREAFEQLAFRYGHSRKYLSDILAVSRVLSKRRNMKTLLDRLGEFVSSLTDGSIDDGHLEFPCKIPTLFSGSPPKERVEPVYLQWARGALQKFTNCVFEYLAR